MQRQAQTVIGRLRVRGARAGGQPIEQRARRVLDAGEWEGAGLSASAILCIRRLADPQPRQLRLDESAMRPPATWEFAKRNALGSLATRAARPSRGFVPATADAVLFLDHAELLACLARDWCEGRLAARWWWRALFRTNDEAAAVLAAWGAAPEYVPAAIHLMATWTALVPFVARVAPRDAAALAARVAGVFGVPIAISLAANAVSPDGRDIEPPAAQRAAQTSRGVREAMAPGVATECTAVSTIQLYAPELVAAELDPAQQQLGYLGLVLHRAPSYRRCDLMAPDVLAAVRRAASLEAPMAELRPAVKVARETAARAAVAAATMPSMLPVAPVEHDRPVGAATADATFDRATRNAAGDGPGIPPPETLWARPAEAAIDTAFGGTFYLINVALSLGLYGDFTQPADRGLDLSIWDFLARLAKQFVGSDELDADPLTPLLASLAGRRADDATDEDLRLSTSWDEWIAWLAPMIAVRLGRALGVPAHEASDLVIRRRARVTVSPAQLDVTFALDDLPIEIRLAGLDRNPGFVPAAGLGITFIYA